MQGPEVVRQLCSPEVRQQGAYATQMGRQLRLSIARTLIVQLSLWMILCLCGRAWCQTASTGDLSGEVLDSAGKAIVQALVHAEEMDTSIGRSTLSDDQGQFVLPLLPPGVYREKVTKRGFSQAQPISVRVTVTESTRVSIPMKVAGVSQTIQVQASVSQLQSDSIALGRAVDSRAIQ